MSKFFRLSILVVLCIITTQAMAQNTISIQSTLKNISGDAVPDGLQPITFKLYTVDEGGSAVWMEEMVDVDVVSGIYSHELGSVTPLVPTDFGVQLYLGVTINNKELLPRTKLGYAPYAMSVTSLAASGESASFDSNGQFNVSDDMSVAGETFINGITNTGNISTTGKLGIGTISPGGTLDMAINAANTGISGDANALKLYVNSINTARVTILSNGRVGIGIDNPETTLHVKSDGVNTGEAILSFFKGFSETQDHLDVFSNQTDICAYFNESIIVKNNILAGAVTAWSDKRIKTNLQQSNSKSDLALLNKIEITEYDHIDIINKDNRRQKKVIAQQVAEVLPNAIQKTRMVIPNVYEVAKDIEYKAGTLTVQTEKAHDFVVGDKIDLKTPKRELDKIEVIAVTDDHTFVVHADEKPENLFVYGKYVDDFLSVDYDAIAMLNVSASQEMYQMILDLQQANKNLIKENTALKSNSANIEDRLSALEAMISKSENDNISNTETAGK